MASRLGAADIVPKNEEKHVIPGYQFTFSDGNVELDLVQQFLNYVVKSVADRGGKIVMGLPGSTYAQV